MESLLPEVTDRACYNELFREDRHWERAIAHLAEKHGLSGKIQRGSRGSHIVYRIGDHWLKLMAPIFRSEMAFELSGLRAVHGNLSVPTPQVIAEGELEGWPYVVLTHVAGEPIRNVWAKFSPAQKSSLAEQIAQITREISRCQPDDVITKRFDWNVFIASQYEDCEEQQRKKGVPDRWLASLRDFLHRFDLSEFQTHEPVFLHADLTFDHFLVSGGHDPKVTGVIDMADCQVGHFEYELVAPSIFVFKSDPGPLKRYLSRCGNGDRNMNGRFSEKLLAWSILHRYFSMISYFQSEMSACESGDYSSLARMVFPLD